MINLSIFCPIYIFLSKHLDTYTCYTAASSDHLTKITLSIHHVKKNAPTLMAYRLRHQLRKCHYVCIRNCLRVLEVSGPESRTPRLDFNKWVHIHCHFIFLRMGGNLHPASRCVNVRVYTSSYIGVGVELK